MANYYLNQMNIASVRLLRSRITFIRNFFRERMNFIDSAALNLNQFLENMPINTEFGSAKRIINKQIADKHHIWRTSSPSENKCHFRLYHHIYIFRFSYDYLYMLRYRFEQNLDLPNFSHCKIIIWLNKWLRKYGEEIRALSFWGHEPETKITYLHVTALHGSPHNTPLDSFVRDITKQQLLPFCEWTAEKRAMTLSEKLNRLLRNFYIASANKNCMRKCRIIAHQIILWILLTRCDSQTQSNTWSKNNA